MKISIIIPVYNGEMTIKRAIDSALNQDFNKKYFEIIVINDGSNDNTFNILKSYNKKIKIINQKNKGSLNACNKGFKKAVGEYVIKLDSDDYFKKDILKEMFEIAKSNPNIDFIYCDYIEITERGKIKRISTKKNIFNTLASGILIKKEKFKKEGFYDEKIQFAEYDFLLKIIDKWSFYHIPKSLFYYIRSKESITGNKEWINKAIDELIKKYPDKLKIIKKIRKY